jgi:Ca2+-binding EF-hand superfamily protein
MIGNVEQKIIQKIMIQWKTIRKAFTDINMEKTGTITKKELKFFLDFWGMDVNE